MSCPRRFAGGATQAAVRQGIEAARLVAADLAGEGLMDWQLVFRLVRRLQTLPAVTAAYGRDPRTIYPAVEAFCTAIVEQDIAAGFKEFGDVDAQFLEAVYWWPRVKFREGTGPLEWAFERAAWAPIVPAVRLSEDFARLASTAYWLQRAQGDAPIILPVGKVSHLFARTNRMFGSRLVRVGSHEDSPRASHEHSPRGCPPA